jgi:hypothetical protein
VGCIKNISIEKIPGIKLIVQSPRKHNSDEVASKTEAYAVIGSESIIWNAQVALHNENPSQKCQKQKGL